MDPSGAVLIRGFSGFGFKGIIISAGEVAVEGVSQIVARDRGQGATGIDGN